ncbi:MAG: oligosaccharide flippase family protein [Acidobacteriia bacterium]|nr:oligosaccharide flippase family protein [Terriglobia bacterium]
MKGEVGQLIKHSGIYGLGTILSKSVGFLMIPVYTRYLVPADYGVLELLDLVIFFSGIFAMMGIGSAFFRFYVAADSAEEKKTVAITALFSVVGISLLVLVLMELHAGTLSTVAFGNATYAPLVRIVALTLFFSNLTEVPFAYLRAQQRTVLFVIIGLARTVLGATMLIVAVVVLQKGVPGVVYANLISNALVGVTLIGALMVRVRGKFSREKYEQMLRYGAPLIVESLAMFALVFSDRFFLRHFASLSEVGIYGLGYKLAGIVSLLVSGPFSMTWSWQQFELAKNENAKVLYARIQTYQLLVCVCIGLAVAVMAKDILRIMTPSGYWASARIVPIIALCYVVDNVRSVVMSGILIQRVTHHLASISLVVATVNLGLNYLLISRFHAMGAAVATLLSYALFLILSYGIAQRVYFVRYEYGRNAAVLALAILLYLASAQFRFQLLSSIAVNGLLFLLFPVVSAMMLDREEREMFLQLGLKVAHRLRALIPQGEV